MPSRYYNYKNRMHRTRIAIAEAQTRGRHRAATQINALARGHLVRSAPRRAANRIRNAFIQHRNRQIGRKFRSIVKMRYNSAAKKIQGAWNKYAYKNRMHLGHAMTQA